MPHNGRLSTPGSFRKKVIRANLISTPTSPACDASSLKHRSMVAVSAFSGGCVLASEALGHYGSSALSLTSTKREEKFPWWLMNESTRVVEEQTGGTNAAHQEDSMQTSPSSLIPTCHGPLRSGTMGRGIHQEDNIQTSSSSLIQFQSGTTGEGVSVLFYKGARVCRQNLHGTL